MASKPEAQLDQGWLAPCRSHEGDTDWHTGDVAGGHADEWVAGGCGMAGAAGDSLLAVDPVDHRRR